MNDTVYNRILEAILDMKPYFGADYIKSISKNGCSQIIIRTVKNKSYLKNKNFLDLLFWNLAYKDVKMYKHYDKNFNRYGLDYVIFTIE